MKGKNEICNNYVKNENSIFNCKLYSSSLEPTLKTCRYILQARKILSKLLTFVYLVFSLPKCVKDSLNLRFGPRRMKLENQSSIIVMVYHLGEQRKKIIS